MRKYFDWGFQYGWGVEAENSLNSCLFQLKIRKYMRIIIIYEIDFYPFLRKHKWE